MPSSKRNAQEISELRRAVDARSAQWIDELARDHAAIGEAMAYSVMAGGKRLRPLLVILGCNAFGGTNGDAAMDAACAVEFFHTYTLIHDDLPCMDDDDLRRGHPSAHRRFDEATAVLSGDALLTGAFEVFTRLPARHGVAAEIALACASVLARCGGAHGVISGQLLDLAGNAGGLAVDRTGVERMHLLKTGALMGGALEIGAILGGADGAGREAVRRAGEWAGLAFQIIDDVLDNEASEQALGKTPGKDVERGRVTYTTIAEPEMARRRANECINEALGMLPARRSFDGIRKLFAQLVDRKG